MSLFNRTAIKTPRGSGPLSVHNSRRLRSRVLCSQNIQTNTKPWAIFECCTWCTGLSCSFGKTVRGARGGGRIVVCASLSLSLFPWTCFVTSASVQFDISLTSEMTPTTARWKLFFSPHSARGIEENFGWGAAEVPICSSDLAVQGRFPMVILIAYFDRVSIRLTPFVRKWPTLFPFRKLMNVSSDNGIIVLAIFTTDRYDRLVRTYSRGHNQ